MKQILVLFFIIALVAGCSVDKQNNEIRSDISGGTLKINENRKYSTLFPPTYKDVASSHIISQIHLGLVKFDSKTLAILPGIAHDWDVDNSGTIYTFYLNPNARFHDNACFPEGKGRIITTEDVKYTYTYLATQREKNRNFFGSVDKILGAKEYYKASANGTEGLSIEGIKVINDTTIQLTVDKPTQRFLFNLANIASSILAKEAVEAGLDYVGAGPFFIKELPKPKEPLILFRNENFFLVDDRGEKLPYLNNINISFIGSTKSELRMFVDDQLDIVFGLPNDYIIDILNDHIEKFESKPPLYILSKVEGSIHQKRSKYNLYKANIRNFYTNNLNVLDLSIVYFKEPGATEEQFK